VLLPRARARFGQKEQALAALLVRHRRVCTELLTR
jgi:hypothetical protein